MEFEKIYQLYFREVFLYVRSLTPDEVTAEEIAQETFVKALNLYYSRLRRESG